MSNKTSEVSRFHNTDRGIVVTPRKEHQDHAHNPRDRALARRRRFGLAATTVGTIALATGIAIGAQNILEARQRDANPYNNPNEIALGTTRILEGAILREEPYVVTQRDIEKDHISDNVVNWDDVEIDGTDLEKATEMDISNALVVHIPRSSNPNYTESWILLKDVKAEGDKRNLYIKFDDPNVAHPLDNIVNITPDPNGNLPPIRTDNQTITPDQMGVVTLK